MEINVILNDVIDVEEAMVGALMEVDGEVGVAVSSQGLSQLWNHETIQELVTCSHIYISRRQFQRCTLCVENVTD